MKKNYIVVKVGLIDNGELNEEIVYQVEWKDNTRPASRMFHAEMLHFLESDASCVVTVK